MPKHLHERKYEKGQAIAEMMVSMIAILAVFLGLLCIGSLSVERIRVTLNARSESEQASYEGLYGDSGQMIREWNLGDDGVAFTPDDTAVTWFGGADSTFSDNVASSDGTYNLMTDTDSNTVTNNFARDENISGSSLFVDAADLTSGTHTVSSPLAERNLEDIVDASKTLFGVDPDFPMSETVYLPKYRNAE